MSTETNLGFGDVDKEKIEEKITELTNPTSIETRIGQWVKRASSSLVWGIVLFILSILAFAFGIFLSFDKKTFTPRVETKLEQAQETTIGKAKQDSTCKHLLHREKYKAKKECHEPLACHEPCCQVVKVQCCAVQLPHQEAKQDGVGIYIFLSLSGLSLLGSIVLLRSYSASSKRLQVLEDEILFLAKIQLAYQTSKTLPEWIEKVPAATDSVQWSQKTSTRGKEYSYPQTYSQQQIIEALIGK